MDTKKKSSCLIPYTYKGDEVLVYLQKRNENFERNPGNFGLFGGMAEGNEIREETLLREIKEELNFVPENFSFFKAYDTERGIKSVFIMKVENDFEDKIQVLEGDYGKWFNEQEVINESKMRDSGRSLLKEFYD